MEFADTPIVALRHGARGDREHAAIELLDWEGSWLRRAEVARHVTVTMPADGHYEDDSATATLDGDGVVATLTELSENPTAPDRADLAALAVACSLARGHLIQQAGQVTGEDEWHETGPRHLMLGRDR